jgi:hypothetical protein
MVLSQRSQYFLPQTNDTHQHHELSAIPPSILPLRLLSPMTYNMEKSCAGTSQPSPLVGGGNGLVICQTLFFFSGSPLRRIKLAIDAICNLHLDSSIKRSRWRHSIEKGGFLKSVQYCFQLVTRLTLEIDKVLQFTESFWTIPCL